MKKLIIGSIMALSMTCIACASDCAPEEAPKVGCVYQIELNAYTTKGVAQGTTVFTSVCAPGDDVCVVKRGKDKTVLRGYVYVCDVLCDLGSYDCKMNDKRGAVCTSPNFTWLIQNIIGTKNNDAEVAFEIVTAYDFGEDRVQDIKLTCCGYGRYNGTVFDNMSGYFTGTGSAPYDLKTKYNANNPACACLCEPSKVLTCTSIECLEYEESDTVFFGNWKMKYNANKSKAYTQGKFAPEADLAKMVGLTVENN